MTLRNLVFSFLQNSFYLLKSELPRNKKSKIFWLYVWYTLTLPKTKKRHLKTIDFLGLKVKAFDLWTFYYLFSEVFVKNEYYFNSKSQQPAILDCGANMGMSVLYFKYLYPNAHITAFEPDPETFELLQENVKINDFQGVHLHNVALADKEGELSFYISSDPGSLVMSIKQERILEEEKIMNVESKEVKVKTKKLSDYITGDVDLLKIDVEGAEDLVMPELEHSGKLKNIQEMIMEYHHKVGTDKSKLSKMLSLFESNEFEYQMDMINMPLSRKEVFQDIHIDAYRLNK